VRRTLKEGYGVETFEIGPYDKFNDEIIKREAALPF